VSSIAIKYFSVLRTNWIQALEYRANALVGVLAIFSGLFIEYQIWDLIFKAKGYTTVKNFEFNELIMFIFLSIIIGQLKSSWHSSGEMIRAIRTGEINKYLIRPISYFWYHFMMFIGFNSLYYIVYSIILFGFTIIFKGMIFHTLASILCFILALVLSIYLSYCIYFIMVCFAFWFGEVRSLVVSYNLAMLVLSGQYVPIRFFPDYILNIINWTPIRYLVDFPVSIATGILPIEEWLSGLLMATLWCFVLSICSAIIYKLGIKDYEAYGS
tara:strand:- start:22030 stop:22839 length:810 start_codon:yes stop_codon:yes gene_type:complete